MAKRDKKTDVGVRRRYVKKTKEERTLDLAKIVYDNDRVNVAIHQEKLCFHISYRELREQVLTFDVAEAVAAMMRIPKLLLNKDIWQIKLSPKDKEIQPLKALYWLSGAEEWNTFDNYNVTWSKASTLLENNFGNKMKNCIKKCQNLNDIKEALEKEFNLSTIYEYALSVRVAK